MSPAVFIFVIPALYVALQYAALRYMQRGWQIAAILPAVAMGASLVVFILGILVNANNLAMWLVLGLPIATLYLACLLPLHWVAERHTSAKPAAHL